jgi:protein-disulfide isomerase
MLAVVGIGMFTPVIVWGNEWISEEVLKQLIELKSEVRQLSQEVTELRAVIEQSRDTPYVDVSSDPSKGSPLAKVAIVEFSDFECPYCSKHSRVTFPDIYTNYVLSGRVQYFSKQFPLDFHPQARGAATAALCAEQQRSGGYWQLHEEAIKPGVDLSQSSLAKLAERLDLDPEMFTQCSNSNQVAAKIDSDIAAGSRLGVKGTPAFYIGRIENGKVVGGSLIRGAQPYSVFARAIDQILIQ